MEGTDRGRQAEQRLYGLDAWRESPYYTDRERAALAWAEAVTPKYPKADGQAIGWFGVGAPTGQQDCSPGQGRLAAATLGNAPPQYLLLHFSFAPAVYRRERKMEERFH